MTNEKKIDISQKGGTVIIANSINTVQNVNASKEDAIEWMMLLHEYEIARSNMKPEQFDVFARGYEELESALKKKDESGLKKSARKLGEFGIDLLKRCSASILSNKLLEMLN